MVSSSLILAGLFFVLNLPEAYKFTGSILKSVINTSKIGVDGSCFNTGGHIAHTLIFFILTLALMSLTNVFTESERRMSIWGMVKYSFCGTLLFYILSSKETYMLVSDNINKDFITDGCPNNKGVLAHTVVFFIIKHLLTL